MVNSIPFDPRLALGQLINEDDIKALQNIAEVEKPLGLAKDRLDNLILTSYRLQALIQQLKAMKVSPKKMEKITNERTTVKEEIAQASVEYLRTAVRVLREVKKLKDEQPQKTISFSLESPIDYERSEVTQFPLSYDSLKFDVQYFRKEENTQSNDTHSKTIGSYVSSTFQGYGVTSDRSISTSANESVSAQVKQHNIEGTIVISAYATHKNVDLISPFRIDPEKAVSAWNQTFPEEEIDLDIKGVFEAALNTTNYKDKKKKTLSLLSGCSKGSSFVGFVHVIKTETDDISQSAESAAKGIQEAMEVDLWLAKRSGGTTNSKSFAKSAKNVMSRSNLNTHACLVCRGMIPNIAVNELQTAVTKMEMDPKQIMEQLAAISKASNHVVNDSMSDNNVDATLARGATGGKFMALNNEYTSNCFSALADHQTEANQVIDTNSLLTAFEDFVAQAAGDGGGGVPINFLIKQLTKNDIAKAYVNKFYPSGMSSGRDAQRGQIGMTPTTKEE
mmetsp:Transcript_27053/g.30879  ORF Transcript_27053/g.30879 Transcript_27053/m.30879 type:complete len:505 (-) Transcript_27053:14-1528(-)|eukprot:CAMPEP_0194195706 /NCGR_PEP_ID=MMETSP0154-20130528/76277_1 /TAXON_ID=1049557 /ORGANISM="Thalassiothrix antarctica, Strain L6-D1" /LENGTH=504 /DNA_ID=CAMNT_0038920251 /DNA_START=18 /DNA_END=1532 /DNA_ORIENTATION=+